MKKLISLALAAAVAIGASAQLAEVSTPKQLLKGIETNLYHPVLSADGSQLMVSDLDYSNLRVYDFNDKVTERRKASKAQAMDAVFRGDELVFAPSVRTEGSQIFITKNGVERAYSPVEGSAGYLWESLSPDGTKIVFLAAGKGLVVIDTDGNILARPGNYECPAWFGNNHLLVQNATDDGHQLQSSQILLMTLDGAQRQALTKPESMSMDPTGSMEANRVVFNTIDGRLYEMTVKLK